jgi:GTP:adenosylcobinamide-phosphate guanylyltransferase
MKPYIRDSKYIKDTREALRKLGKTPVEVVTDYLRLLWQHTLKEMIAVDGEAEVEGQPLKVIITHPAIWPL